MLPNYCSNAMCSYIFQIEEKEPVNKGVRVAVGYGACKDVFSKGSVVVDPPVSQYPPKKHHHSISSMKELQEIYSLFFDEGSAAE